MKGTFGDSLVHSSHEGRATFEVGSGCPLYCPVEFSVSQRLTSFPCDKPCHSECFSFYPVAIYYVVSCDCLLFFFFKFCSASSNSLRQKSAITVCVVGQHSRLQTDLEVSDCAGDTCSIEVEQAN